MKKLLLFCIAGMLSFTSFSLKAQEVIRLGVTDSITYTLKNYTGTATDITVVIPAGYTNPEYSKGKNIVLTSIPATITNVTIQGDGSNPTLLLKTVDLPSSFSLTTFRMKDITIKGTDDPVSVALTNYLLAPTATSPATVTVTNVTFDGCSIANFRGVVRMKTGAVFTNLSFNNCIVRNIKDYNVLVTETGSTLTNFSFRNSTVYGTNGSIFTASGNTPSTFTIADCTFDNIIYTSGKYFIDFGTSNTTTALSISNSVFGKTANAGAKGIRGGTGFTYTVTNCYTTTDWVTVANALVGFTAYTNASTVLFKQPTTFDNTAANPTASVGDYSYKDTGFAGVTSAGDPRWYTSTPVDQIEKTHAVVFDGKILHCSETTSIKVFSITGHLLKSALNVSQLSVADLAKGTYIIKTSNSVCKIMKN